MSTKAVRAHSRKIRSGDNATQLDGLDGLARFGPLAAESVPQLIKLLNGYDNAVRSRAANVLGRIGPAASEAVPKLNELLGDGSPAVRAAAAKAVGRIGPVGLPDLIESLVFGDEGMKVQAARAIAALGGDARFAVPHLTHALRDQSPRVRKEAARALATLNVRLKEREIKALIDILKKEPAEQRPALAEALSSYTAVAKSAVPMLRRLAQREPKKGKPDVRPVAIQALGRLGPIARMAVPDLMALQTGEDSPRRSPALVALGRIGEGAAEAVPELLTLLPDAGEKRKLLIVEALGRIGPKAAEAVPVLMGMLPEAYGALREQITVALGGIGKAAEPAIPHLVGQTRDQSIHVRLDAIRALGRIGIPDKHAVKALIFKLEDREAEARLAAIEALASLHLNAAPLTPHLYGRLADRDGRVRRSAAHILARLGVRDKRIADRCRNALQSPYGEVRYEAAEFLWRFGRGAKDVLQVLPEMVQDPDRSNRQRGLELLSEIAQADDKALDALVRALDNPDEPLGRPATTALISAGPRAVPALTHALKKGSRAVRSGALQALARIGSARKNTVSAIADALDDEEEDVRWAAAWGLGAVSRGSESAVQALAELLDDGSSAVRNWAALALSRRGEDAVPALCQVLRKPSADTRIAACRALALIGAPSLPAMSELGPMLRDDDRNLRQAVDRVLDRVAGGIELEIGPLRQLLVEDNRGFQEWAAMMLRPHGVRVLPMLMRQLGEGQQAGNQAQIWGATEGLANLGERGEPALPLLLSVLEAGRNLDSEIRERVGYTLGRIGPAAVPGLIAALGHADAEVRLGAIDGLSRIGEPASEAGPELVRMVQSDVPPAVGQFIGEAVADLGPAAVSELVDALRSARKPEVTARLVRAVGVVGPAAEAARPELVSLLTHDEPSVRQEALWALGRVGPGADGGELADRIAGRLADPDAGVREMVPAALGRLGDAATSQLPGLVKQLDDNDASRRHLALRAIGEIARAAKPTDDPHSAIPAVVARLKGDPDTEVRAEAARTLPAFRSADAGAVRKALAGALGEAANRTQIVIIDSLTSLGGDAAGDLRKALDSANGLVRRDAFLALVKLEPDAAVDLAAKRLTDPDWVISRDSAKLLGEAGDRARSAVPQLVGVLHSPLRETRDAAFEALKKLDPDGAQTVPAMINGLTDRNGDVRSWCAQHVGEYGEKAAEAVPLLVLLASDWQHGTGGHARQSIQRIGAAGAEGFKSVLTHSKKKVRDRAFQALRWMDWQSGNTLQPFQKQLGNPPKEVMEKIDEALAFLGGKPGETKQLLRDLKSKQGWHPPYTAAMQITRLCENQQPPTDDLPQIVEALINNLGNRDYDVRRETAKALGAIGEPAQSAAPKLAELIGDSDNRVAVAAIMALDQLGEIPEATLDTLIKLLNPKKNRPDTMESAARVLGRQGPRAAKAIPALRTTLAEAGWDVSMWAAWALGEIGGADDETLKSIRTTMETPHPRMQAWVAAAFAKLCDDAQPVRDVLGRVLPCDDADTACGLARAITLRPELMADLLAALQHEDVRVRLGAVRVLGRLCVASEEAAPALERAAEDEDAGVRAAATKTLEKHRDGKIREVPTRPGMAEEETALPTGSRVAG